VQAHVDAYRQKVLTFYFDVMLSGVKCPACGGRLEMTGQSECTCTCEKVWDPTVEFQKSSCCGAGLVRKTFHYSCSKCHAVVSSRFIFNERVFDKEYFREMMRESRNRKERKREEIRRLLAESRSKTLVFIEEPELDTIPGLVSDLNEFILGEDLELSDTFFENGDIFNIEKYWSHIQSRLGWDPVHFSEIPSLDNDGRKDRAYRFITLIYMQGDREVEIEQLENDLLIQRAYNEAHC